MVVALGLWATYRISFAEGVLTREATTLRSGQVLQVIRCSPGVFAPRSCAADISWADGTRSRGRVWSTRDVPAGTPVTEHSWSFGVRDQGRVIAPQDHPRDGSMLILAGGLVLSLVAGAIAALLAGRLLRARTRVDRTARNVDP